MNMVKYFYSEGCEHLPCSAYFLDGYVRVDNEDDLMYWKLSNARELTWANMEHDMLSFWDEPEYFLCLPKPRSAVMNNMTTTYYDDRYLVEMFKVLPAEYFLNNFYDLLPVLDRIIQYDPVKVKNALFDHIKSKSIAPDDANILRENQKIQEWLNDFNDVKTGQLFNHALFIKNVMTIISWNVMPPLHTLNYEFKVNDFQPNLFRWKEAKVRETGSESDIENMYEIMKKLCTKENFNPVIYPYIYDKTDITPDEIIEVYRSLKEKNTDHLLVNFDKTFKLIGCKDYDLIYKSVPINELLGIIRNKEYLIKTPELLDYVYRFMDDEDLILGVSGTETLLAVCDESLYETPIYKKIIQHNSA